MSDKNSRIAVSLGLAAGYELRLASNGGGAFELDVLDDRGEKVAGTTHLRGGDVVAFSDQVFALSKPVRRQFSDDRRD